MIGRTPHAGARSAPGFTVAELLVVLLIIGIATAVVVPALRGPEEGAAREGARELAAVYTAARDAALARGRPVEVRIDPRTGGYAVIAAAPAWASPDTLRAGRIPGGPGALVAAVAGPIATVFDPLRRARGRAVIIRDGEDRYEVAVDRWTAVVRVRRR